MFSSSGAPGGHQDLQVVGGLEAGGVASCRNALNRNGSSITFPYAPAKALPPREISPPIVRFSLRAPVMPAPITALIVATVSASKPLPVNNVLKVWIRLRGARKP